MKRMLWALALVFSLAVPSLANADCEHYGAIAYSPSTGQNGASWDWGDEGTANAQAISACNAGDCQSVVWVRDACAALAVGSDASDWGWAWNTDLGEAKAGALAQCSTRSLNCQVVRWVCST